MPTPDFIVDLRRRIGHAPLWLPGVSVVVFDDERRVLVQRRSDFGTWGLIGGIVEPGEEPAVAAARECAEETGVEVEITGLLSVMAEPEFSYPNGDRVQFLTHAFVARYLSGEARVADDESLEVGWFAMDGLPGLVRGHRDRIDQAVGFNGVTVYRTTPPDR